MQSIHFFSLDEPQLLIDYLKKQQWIHSGEQVEDVTKAGEGNMNFVARIHTNMRTMIFKQSRPWVEKYPQFEAPIERIESEITFYESIERHPEIKAGMPTLLAFDKPGKSALFEDLGKVEDYASMYDSTLPPAEELRALIQWVSSLHNASFPEALKETLSNLAMRKLNHAHLFDIPLQPNNGLALDDINPGLHQEATKLQQNEDYKSIVHSLGETYLDQGNTLLHGDYYPGSWVRTPEGPRVIDPEFAFFGPAEYDIGVCIGHLLMAGYEASNIQDIMSSYERPINFDDFLAHQFAGMEIMRRLIGVAQLPLTRNIDEKRVLLEYSRQLVTKRSRLLLL